MFIMATMQDNNSFWLAEGCQKSVPYTNVTILSQLNQNFVMIEPKLCHNWTKTNQ